MHAQYSMMRGIINPHQETHVRRKNICLSPALPGSSLIQINEPDTAAAEAEIAETKELGS
jgi:hypothetical protein